MNRITMILACTAVLLCGCAKQSLENIYSNQEAKIDSFISGLLDSNPEYSVVHNNGSNRVIMSQGTGPALKEGGRISFYYAGYTFNGNLNASNIFATNNQAFAEENGWSVSDPDYEVKTAVLAEGELLEGLRQEAHRHNSCKLCAGFPDMGGKSFRIGRKSLYLQLEFLTE